MDYNRKCIGCGNYLSADKDSISYVAKFDKNIKYCIRCYRLKHYGEISNLETDEKIKEKLNDINFENNLIIMILDLFDLKNSIVDTKKFKSDVLVVVNKASALPKKFNKEITKEKILLILEENKIDPIDVILYDAIEKINLRKIMNYIDDYSFEKKKIYFIGKTNVGKSSLINALLKINKKNPELVCSPIKNTTLNILKIKINKTELLDTPGFSNNESILNNIDDNEILNISKYKFNSVPYFLSNENQLFAIEKLFFILIKDISKEINSSIVFYKSSYLKISKMKKEKMVSFIQKNSYIKYKENFDFIEHKFKLEENKKYSIFASGISLIVLKGVKNISIFLPKEINFYITKNSII